MVTEHRNNLLIKTYFVLLTFYYLYFYDPMNTHSSCVLTRLVLSPHFEVASDERT